MKTSLSSSLLLALCLGLAACAETRVTDRAVSSASRSVSAERLGRALLVVEAALPGDSPDRDVRAAEAVRHVWQALDFASGEVTESASEEQLLAHARDGGLDSVLIVRVEDYARLGNLRIGFSLPPVSWETNTVVSLRLRVLDVRTGAVVTDLRRDRVRGGLFSYRTVEDIPGELREVLRTLVVAG